MASDRRAMRAFTPTDDQLIRDAHAGRMHMRALFAELRASPPTIYRRMAELGLPYRKSDRRTRPALRRDFLKLLKGTTNAS